MFCGAVMILTLEKDALNVLFLLKSIVTITHREVRWELHLKVMFFKRGLFEAFIIIKSVIIKYSFTGSNSPFEGDMYLLPPLIRAVHMDWWKKNNILAADVLFNGYNRNCLNKGRIIYALYLKCFYLKGIFLAQNVLFK